MSHVNTPINPWKMAPAATSCSARFVASRRQADFLQRHAADCARLRLRPAAGDPSEGDQGLHGDGAGADGGGSAAGLGGAYSEHVTWAEELVAIHCLLFPASVGCQCRVVLRLAHLDSVVWWMSISHHCIRCVCVCMCGFFLAS